MCQCPAILPYHEFLVACRALTSDQRCLSLCDVTRQTGRFLSPRVLFRTVFLGLDGGCGRRLLLFQSNRNKRVLRADQPVCLSHLREGSWLGLAGGHIELRSLILAHMTSSCQRQCKLLQLPVRISGCKPSAIFCGSRRRASESRSANAAYHANRRRSWARAPSNSRRGPKVPKRAESGEASVFDFALPRSKARPRSLSFSGQSGPLHLHSARDPGARRHRIGLPRRRVLPSPSRRCGPEATSELLLGQRSEPLGPGAIQEERGPEPSAALRCFPAVSPMHTGTSCSSPSSSPWREDSAFPPAEEHKCA